MSEPFEIVIEHAGSQTTLQQNSPRSLLELSLQYDCGIEYGCRGGSCGICVIQIHRGMENLSEESDAEEVLLPLLTGGRDDVRLACQITIHGPVHIETCDEY